MRDTAFLNFQSVQFSLDSPGISWAIHKPVSHYCSLSTNCIYNTNLPSMDAIAVLISHWHDHSLGTIDLLINLKEKPLQVWPSRKKSYKSA